MYPGLNFWMTSGNRTRGGETSLSSWIFFTYMNKHDSIFISAFYSSYLNNKILLCKCFQIHQNICPRSFVHFIWWVYDKNWARLAVWRLIFSIYHKADNYWENKLEGYKTNRTINYQVWPGQWSETLQNYFQL